MSAEYSVCAAGAAEFGRHVTHKSGRIISFGLRPREQATCWNNRESKTRDVFPLFQPWLSGRRHLGTGAALRAKSTVPPPPSLL